jgi:hypothetical protein
MVGRQAAPLVQRGCYKLHESEIKTDPNGGRTSNTLRSINRYILNDVTKA